MSDVFADMQAAMQQSAPTEAAPPPVDTEAVPSGEVTAEAHGAEPVRGEHGRARDEQGRFAPKAKVDRVEIIDPSKPKEESKPAEVKPVKAETAAAEPAKPAEVAPAEAKSEPALKPPQSWKPLAREAWAKIPAEAQAEIARREAEITKGLNESAPDRKLAHEVREVLRPYESILAMEGLQPVQAVQALMRTAAILRQGTPHQKASVLVSEMRKAGVSEAELAAALDGTPAPAQGAQTAALPPEVAQIVTEWQAEKQRKAQESQATQAKQVAELQAFVESHEFAEDLIPDMTAIAAAARQAGRSMSTGAVYAKAIAMQKADPDSEIGKVLRQREEAEKAAKALASTQQARVAGAVSVKTQPAPAAAPVGGKTVYDDMQAAIASLSGR